MDGEGFLGPLSKAIEPYTSHKESTGQIWWRHIDRASGATFVEDPRLGLHALPEGWRRKSHLAEEFWTWFVNDETGEELMHGMDQRFRNGCLSRRKLDLETFVFV
jgi:hypothetical protein